MAILANTFTRYTAIGQREQLSDVIYNISPEDTPIITRAGKESVKGTLYEWQTDSLAATDTSNAQLEGDDIAATAWPAVTPTVRVGNYCQISRKLLVLSDTLEVVDKAGRKSELAYQLAMRGAELKRDMEAIVLQNLGGNAGGTATARQTATLGAWLKSNVDLATDGGNPTYTSGVPGAARTDGTGRAFTETIFKHVLQLVWTSGGNPQDVFLGPVNKVKASGFAGVVTRNYDMSQAKPTVAIAAVDVYVSDFGTVKIFPSRFQREADGWVLDFQYIKLTTLRPFKTVPLAKTGDAEKRMLVVEWGLKVTQEAALGLAADLTTT